MTYDHVTIYWLPSNGAIIQCGRKVHAIKAGRTSQVQQYALAARGAGDRQRKQKDLLEVIELAIGMKVMVTSNIATDLDIANGARGAVVDIILDPEEPLLGDNSIVTLKRLPQCVLVRLNRTCATRLDGLDDSVVPIFPAKSSMQITLGKKVKTVTCFQYPITAAYCFTDYRSQGQTIPHVIVDITSPPVANFLCLICMLLYRGVLGKRQSDCFETLMMTFFWRHMRQS